ncbi:DUF6876 family protein [Acidisoma sp. 7E03]
MDTQATKLSPADLQAGLAMHTGTERWFKHWSQRLIYTEGVRFLAEHGSAYWLIDLVASWCAESALRGEGFITWKLLVNDDRSAVAIAEDGNGRELTRQAIPWTDFPLDEVQLYLIDGTLLLPSEY